MVGSREGPGNFDAASRATARLLGDARGIATAVDTLSRGGLVAFPTETVYGLGACADDARAVAGIYRAKGRPARNPLIVHVADAGRAAALGRFDEVAQTLAAAFWPGPLTLVLTLRPEAGLAPAATAGGATVALRVPSRPVARRMLDILGRPVAAPSANRSGRISPTRASHVAAELDGRIDAILDDGPCAVGLESTIVGIGGAVRLLRPGGISAEAIEAVLGRSLAPPASGGASVAPGQFASHYAPAAALRLEARDAVEGERFLGFGDTGGALNLSPAADLREAAANLFDHLRRLDAEGARIAVAPIPDHGLGRAINDRLRRAAAPRPTPVRPPPTA